MASWATLEIHSSPETLPVRFIYWFSESDYSNRVVHLTVYTAFRE